MYTITKQFTFEAAHQLHLPYASKCNNMHGHSYRVELVLQAENLNSNEMLVDFQDLQKFSHFLDANFDHKFLNDVIPAPTTAENIAAYLYLIAKAMWSQVYACRVSET